MPRRPLTTTPCAPRSCRGSRGRFLFSNVAIGSDYLAFVAILFGFAVLATAGLILSSRHGVRD